MKFIAAILFTLTSIASALPSPIADGSQGLHTLSKRAADRAPVYQTCKNPKQIAITFDDGVYQYESEIATYLRSQNVTATFFVNGYNWGCIYDTKSVEMLKAIKSNGHQIASHTWSHPDMTTLSETNQRKQFDLVETALKKILGVTPKFLRFPYGSYNTRLLEISKEYHYEVIQWNADTEDADGATVAYSESVYKQVIADYPSAAIVLNHSPYKTTAETVIKYAVPKLKAKGFEFVDVATCTGYTTSQRYKTTTTAGTRDSTWTCSGTPAPSDG